MNGIKRFLSVGVAVAMSVSLFVVPSFAETAAPFQDVDSANPNVDAVSYLKAGGVVMGYGDGNFAPDNTINRAEFMKMVMVASGTSVGGANCFSDVKGEWYATYICSAKKMGIVGGYSDGTFRPDLNISIAEASKIVAKAFGLNGAAVAGDVWFKPFVTALAEKNAIPVSIDYADKKLTRGEMAEMMWRVKAGIETKATKTFASLTDELPTMNSCGELKEKLVLQQYHQGYGRGSGGMPLMMEKSTGASPVEAPQAANMSSTSGAADYSTTNVQVAGVDEADIVKNDANYIYMIKGRSIRIVKAAPAGAMQEVSRVAVDDTSFTPSEMFINGDVLVVVGGTYDAGFQTVIYLYDVSDRANVKQTRRIAFEGNYVSSRRIGNFAYFVMNAYPDYSVLQDATSDGSGLIPKFTDSKSGKAMPVVSCSSIHIFPRYTDPNFLIIAGVPLVGANAAVTRSMYLGSGTTIYSSTENMYVATQKYEYNDWVRYNFWRPPAAKESTVFYRFALKNGMATFMTTGSVGGTLLNQFSMDESGDAFRVATTKGNFWMGMGQQPTNQLVVLDKNNLSTVLGEVKDIGKGETIKAVRFMGARAYVVTFKNTDPFFVIDVANPRAPKLLGELKIPGYSDYLQPYDENHLIGFGKDAVDPTNFPTSNTGIIPPTQNNFAWYQGMKLAMFDVTNPTSPKEMFHQVIGDRGTNSELLYNHKALLFDKQKSLLAFPIEIATVANKENVKPDPSTYGEITFRGAIVFNVDLVNGFTLKGKITHVDASDFTTPTDTTSSTPDVMMKIRDPGTGPYFQNYEAIINRIIYIGNTLYTISQKKVQANNLIDLSEQASVTLSKEPDGGSPGPIVY